MVANNLLGIAQNFSSPDIVRMFSNSINEPIDKTKVGLKSIIPTLLMGIVNKGSTTRGAETLVSMVNTHNFESNIVPDENKLREGDDVVNNIFGGNLNTVVSKLGTITGLQSGSITKILGLAAPMVMNLLGSKVKSEGLNPSSLKTFLASQKNALTALIPVGIPSLGGLANTFSSNPDLADRKSWKKIAFLIILAFAALVWLTGRNMKKDIVSQPTAMTNSAVASAQAATVVPALQTVDATSTAPEMKSNLSNFIKDAKIKDLPKRFKFENLSFESGTSTPVAGSATELESIAAALLHSPEATVRIEGFTDNSGEETMNEDLSFRRAVAVKEHLVGRGINPDRIDTAGMGAQDPTASNDSEAGRALNRRVELIVTGI